VDGSMPKYSQSNIRFIIRPGEFKALYQKAYPLENKIWVLLLWLTGGRPEEVIRLKKQDILLEEDKVKIRLETLKKPKNEEFRVTKRNLCTAGENLRPYLESLQKHINRLQRENLFSFSKRTGYNIISRLGMSVLGFPLCPYNFRHSRLTLLAEKGATNDELKRFKGSSTDKSIKPYIHARNVEYTVETTISENL